MNTKINQKVIKTSIKKTNILYNLSVSVRKIILFSFGAVYLQFRKT